MTCVDDSPVNDHAQSSSPNPSLRTTFVDWINAADPSPTSHTLTLAEVNLD